MLVCVSFPVPFLIFKLWLYLAIKENEKLLVLMKVHLWVFANLLPVQDYWEILLESRLNCSHFIERTLEIAKLSRPSLCATELEKNSTWAPKLLPERFGVFVYLRKKFGCNWSCQKTPDLPLHHIFKLGNFPEWDQTFQKKQIRFVNWGNPICQCRNQMCCKYSARQISRN